MGKEPSARGSGEHAAAGADPKRQDLTKGPDRSMAGIVLAMQRKAGNQAVAAAVAPGEGPAVQRLVSYTWDWYTWGYTAWKADAKELWQKIDAKFNKELLPLIARLTKSLGENEVGDLIQFQNRYDGKKLSFAEGQQLLVQVENHLRSAQALVERPTTPPTSDEPTTSAKETSKSPPSITHVPVKVDEEPVVDRPVGPKPGDEATSEGGEPGKGTAEEPSGDAPVDQEPKGEPVKETVPETLTETVAETVKEAPVKETVKEEPVTEEPVTDEPVTEAVTIHIESSGVKKPPPGRKKHVRAPRGSKAKGKKSTKERVEEVVPDPVGVTSPTAAEMAAVWQSKVEALRTAVETFDEDQRPLSGKSNPLLQKAESAVAEIRVLEQGMASYLETVDARRQVVDALAGEAELEVIQELSDETVALETLVREAGVEHMGIDEEVTDLEGEVDLRLNDANASDELLRLRKLWTSESSARGHFNKHTGDTGLATEQAYLAAAEAIIMGGATVRSRVRANGDTVYYDTSNRRFSSVSGAGKIRTLFCPAGGLGYYNRQT